MHRALQSEYLVDVFCETHSTFSEPDGKLFVKVKKNIVFSNDLYHVCCQVEHQSAYTTEWSRVCDSLRRLPKLVFHFILCISFRFNVMVDYNPRDRYLYSWDNAHQVRYKVKIDTTYGRIRKRRMYPRRRRRTWNIEVDPDETLWWGSFRSRDRGNSESEGETLRDYLVGPSTARAFVARRIDFSATCLQARKQLGTLRGAKSFLRGAFFQTMSSSFKLCPTHYSSGGEKCSKRCFAAPATPSYGPACLAVVDRTQNLNIVCAWKWHADLSAPQLGIWCNAESVTPTSYYCL